jgi:hypothetical protein
MAEFEIAVCATYRQKEIKKNEHLRILAAYDIPYFLRLVYLLSVTGKEERVAEY